MGRDREVAAPLPHRRGGSIVGWLLPLWLVGLALIGVACSGTDETFSGAERSLAGPSTSEDESITDDEEPVTDNEESASEEQPASADPDGTGTGTDQAADLGTDAPTPATGPVPGTATASATDMGDVLVWSGTNDDRRILLDQLDQILTQHRQAVADETDRSISAITVEALEGSATSMTVVSCAELTNPAVEIGQGHLRYRRHRVAFAAVDGRWLVEASAVTADDDAAPAPDPLDPDPLDPDSLDAGVGCVTADRAQTLHDVVEDFLAAVQEAQRQPTDDLVGVEGLAAPALLASLTQSVEELERAGVYYDDPQQHWVDVRGANPVLDDGFVVRTCSFYPAGSTALALDDGSVVEAETPFAAGTTLTRSWNVVSEPDPDSDGFRHLVAELRWQRLDQDCRPDESEDHAQ